MCGNRGFAQTLNPREAGGKKRWNGHVKKLCEATRKPEDAPHGTIHKSDCHKERGAKGLKIHSLSRKKTPLITDPEVCAHRISWEGDTRAARRGLWGQGWGAFTLHLGDFLHVALCAHFYSKNKLREFPDSPVVRTPHSHCPRPGFNPWSGN